MKQPVLSFSILSLSLLPNLLAFQSPHVPSHSPNSNSNSNSLKTTPSASSTTTKAATTKLTTTTSNPLIVFPDFEFTPQGICTSPQHFVDAQSRQWFTLRNVPGEGDCMFLAVAVAASLPAPFTVTSSSNSTGSHAKDKYNSITTDNRLAQEQTTNLHNVPTEPMDVSASDADPELVEGESSSSSYWHGLAKNTREAVAQVLESSLDPLYIGKNRPWVKPQDLLRSATKQEGLLSTQDYLQQLRTLGRQGGLYGGGPELTVLSNLLQRPIAIYEIATDRFSNVGQVIRNNGICPIVCRGIFGDGLFDHPPTCSSAPHDNNKPLATNDDGWDDWKLHVLVVDASPLEKHACVLLPMPKEKRKLP